MKVLIQTALFLLLGATSIYAQPPSSTPVGTIIQAHQLTKQQHQVQLNLEANQQYVLYLMHPNRNIRQYDLQLGALQPISVRTNRPDQTKQYLLPTLKTDTELNVTIELDGRSTIQLALYRLDPPTAPVWPAGIYDNLTDLQNQTPTHPLHAEVLQVNKSHGYMALGGTSAFYQLKEGRTFSQKAKDAFAFSDGQHLYLNPTMDGRNKDFVQIERYGDWAYAYYLYPVFTQNPQGAVLTNWYRANFVFNLQTGKSLKLNKATLRHLLADAPQLLADFELERQKVRKLKAYFIQYAAL